METKFIKGLSQVQSRYDAFFIDLWGVMHNGIQLYPEAIKVLENLNKLNKRFVFISNAPRPSENVKRFLLKLKMNKILTKNVFTSGEAALNSLQKNTYGKNFFHLGPERDNSLFLGFEKNKKNLENADFILCTGFLDFNENSLNYYKHMLNGYTHLKMICTNPDLIVHRGSVQEYCAGTLAEIFKKMGGQVIYFGKPYPDIYKFCIQSNEKVLAIGDNIRTDIKGANNMKFDSLFITNGIHKNEFSDIPQESYDKIMEKYNTKTNYYQERLIW
jgi:HAD superfamily hydrolase (TIGR01459 family)|tara:strand:+ start:103 stop:921 length:819 start_codon:yes stop_codon:yes gene_type:complete